MPTIRTALLLLGTALALPGQDAPRAQPPVITLLTRIDAGLGGILQRSDGTQQEFHIEVSATRSALRSTRLSAATPDPLTVDSPPETALLSELERWCDATFTTEDQAAILALEHLPTPTGAAADRSHKQATLLRTVRAYRQVTRPTVDKVFAGRDTVTLSLQLRLADEAPQQILWRRFGADAFARMHLGTEVAAVALDSRSERLLVLALGNWLAGRLGGRAALWEGDHQDAPADTRLVLAAYRGYLSATSPRLRSWGTIMDGAPGGSRTFTLSDARNGALQVVFDFRAGSPTPGRLRDGGTSESPLVELGSERERELLALLKRAAELRRSQLGAERAAGDDGLQALATQLAAYAMAFPAASAPKDR